MTDKAQVTREELMAMREVAGKAYRFAAERWGAFDAAGEAAYLDRVYPLPAPEPQQAKGPSGIEYCIHTPYWSREGRSAVTVAHVHVLSEDRATVANLLCPFEDVVRATLEEMGIKKLNGGDWVWENGPTSHWGGLRGAITLLLPKILKRLEAR